MWLDGVSLSLLGDLLRAIGVGYGPVRISCRVGVWMYKRIFRWTGIHCLSVTVDVHADI